MSARWGFFEIKRLVPPKSLVREPSASGSRTKRRSDGMNELRIFKIKSRSERYVVRSNPHVNSKCKRSAGLHFESEEQQNERAMRLF